MKFNALIVEKSGDSEVPVAVGLAGGATLSTSVIPFLLRGVNLPGIDTVM